MEEDINENLSWEQSCVEKLVIYLKYIYGVQKRSGQVVNYVTICNGRRLKSSHTQCPSYSICRAPFAPFITPLILSMLMVYRMYTVYTLHTILRFDQIVDWPTAGIQLSARSWYEAFPNASFSASSIITPDSHYTCPLYCFARDMVGQDP